MIFLFQLVYGNHDRIVPSQIGNTNHQISSLHWIYQTHRLTSSAQFKVTVSRSKRLARGTVVLAQTPTRHRPHQKNLKTATQVIGRKNLFRWRSMGRCWRQLDSSRALRPPKRVSRAEIICHPSAKKSLTLNLRSGLTHRLRFHRGN